MKNHPRSVSTLFFSRRFYLAMLLTTLLFVACNKEEVSIAPNTLYRVTTAEGDGFARFERVSKRQWKGTYYLNKEGLWAEASPVTLKAKKGLVLTDADGKSAPVLQYIPYEEPEYIDHPETWAYRDSVYAVTVKKDVVYGNAQGYWASYPDTGESFLKIFTAKLPEVRRDMKDLDLTMDVYLPKDTKASLRPLLVLIHGGAFYNGDKTDKGFPLWAKYFAGMGYVVASVNYRLGFRLNTAAVERAGFRAVQDVDAAIRYLIHNKSVYAVDPKRVFVAGTSAGGITALNIAFMREPNIPPAAKDEGGIHALNVNYKDTYVVRAVGNLWGAVNDLSMLKNASSSVISFHSTGDPVVPFGKGHPFNRVLFNDMIFPTMYGSSEITRYLGKQRAQIKPYDLPGKHALHFDNVDGHLVLNSRFLEIKTGLRDFFSKVVNPSPVVIQHKDGSQTFQIKATDIETAYWKVEGGVILEQTPGSIEVLMLPDSPSHSVTVSGKYKSGETFKKVLTLTSE